MKIVSNGKWIQVPPRGPAGPDGNPIGTVISYMGLSAPDAYLICDGTVYPIGEYPDLAKFFQKQFGAVNYFGGDGVTDFSVPDMRNLFLRGYHGESEEQLSGDIGAKQEATDHPYFHGSASLVMSKSRDGGQRPNNPDTLKEVATQIATASIQSTSSNTLYNGYTSRPVNMAVLYCIKAVDSLPNEVVYSTEERRIGTWIDGKPLYQKTVDQYPTSLSSLSGTLIADNVDTLVKQFGVIPDISSTTQCAFPYENGDGRVNVRLSDNKELILEVIGSWNSYSFRGTFEYTKTTDPATTELSAALTATQAQALYMSAPQSAPAVTLDEGIKNEEV